jgi:hypothetical protein
MARTLKAGRGPSSTQKNKARQRVTGLGTSTNALVHQLVHHPFGRCIWHDVGVLDTYGSNTLTGAKL